MPAMPCPARGLDVGATWHPVRFMRAAGRAVVIRSRGLLGAAFLSGSGLGRVIRAVLVTAVLTGIVATAPAAALAAALVWAVLRLRPDATLAWVAAGLVAAVAWPLGLLTGPVLGAVAGALLWRLDQAYREAQPLAGPEERQRRHLHEAGRRRRVVHVVQRCAYGRTQPERVADLAAMAAVPLRTSEGAVLGVRLAGDLHWPRPRGRRSLVVQPTSVPHTVVLGGTRTGKSELVHRMVEADIADPQVKRQVIYLNCKQPSPGDEPSIRLAAVAERQGRTARVLVRDLSPWDPMRGTPDQVRHRLLATEEWSEPYYQAVSNVLLGLALDLSAAEGRPLETLPDVVWSLAQDRLEVLAQDNLEAARLVRMLRRDDVSGAVMRWASQALHLRGWVGPVNSGGWSWEDADVIGVDLPTGTEPGAARQLLRAMLTDLESWIVDPARRPVGPDGRWVPLRLVIEEVGALDADPILMARLVNFMERAAGARVRVVIVAQDPSGLGEDRTADALLTNSAVITCRQSVKRAVDALVTLAGTRRRLEASAAYSGSIADRLGEEGSIRVQDTYKVDPNLLREMGVGEAIVIDRNSWAWIAVAMSEHGYHAPEGQAADLVRSCLTTTRQMAALPPPPTGYDDERGDDLR